MVDSVFAWIAIGAAASLGGMIWPFRRGGAGVLLNFALGIVGAIVLGLVGYYVVPAPQSHGWPLFFAAVGAIVALAAGHAVWQRRADASRPTHRTA